MVVVSHKRLISLRHSSEWVLTSAVSIYWRLVKVVSHRRVALVHVAKALVIESWVHTSIPRIHAAKSLILVSPLRSAIVIAVSRVYIVGILPETVWIRIRVVTPSSPVVLAWIHISVGKEFYFNSI